MGSEVARAGQQARGLSQSKPTGGLAPFGPWLAAMLLAGVCVCLSLPALPIDWPWMWLLLVCMGVLAWWRVQSKLWRSLAVLLVGFALTAAHAQWTLQAQLPVQWEKQDLIVKGRIVSLPQVEARRTRFDFLADTCPGAATDGCGKRLQLSWYDDFDAITAGPRTQLHAGARWQMVVRLRAPRGLANPGGFDSERYSLARRIAATGYVKPGIQTHQLTAASGVDAWREQMSAQIATRAPAGSQRFLRALALGDTSSLGDVDWNTLRAAGLTHLIAISGFHVGLVAGFGGLLMIGVWRVFPRLGRWLPRSTAAALTALLFASGYALLSGFSLPTVRTLLMIAVVALARCGRRPSGGMQSLALATFAVLFVDPLAPLLAGFWLSFAGVGWLIWCLPHSDAPALRQFVSAQKVATVGLLPLSVALFGQASLVGPFANLIAIPWWSLVVVPLALVGTGLEALHPGWGGWIWWLAARAFEPSWDVFTWMGQSRFALWWLAEGPWYALPLAMIGAFWLLLPSALPGKPLALLLWLPLLLPDTSRPARGEVTLNVLDVGQGLSVLVRTSQHALLFDAGPAAQDGFDAGERVVVPALHALGVSKLDRMVVSHGDADHAGGLGAVLLGLPGSQVVSPAGSPVKRQMTCKAGQVWYWDGVKFEMLHPASVFPYLRNEASCVLRVQTKWGAALLPGDIGQVVERTLVREHPEKLKALVVLAPHHGSAESSGPAFVTATGARLTLVSSSYGNRFGHPRPEIVRRWQRAGAEVLNTAESGALTVWLDADGLAVRERRRWKSRLWDAVRVGEAARLSYRPTKTRAGVPEE